MRAIIGVLFGWMLLCAAVNADGLRDFAGSGHTLSEYTGDGRWLVVMIWASDCHLCNEEVASYVRFHEQRHERDARVLGISLDGAAGLSEAEAFVARHQVTFPSLIGEPEAVAALFTELTGQRWIGTPSFLVYAPDGSLSAQQVGAVPVALVESHIAGR